MKLNKFLYSFLLMILVVFSQSCKKNLLDQEPLDRISDATVWKDPLLVQAFINNLYTVLPSWNWYDKVRGITLSSATDESIHQYGYDGIYDMNGGALSASNVTGFDTWSFDYGYIKNCNLFFEKIDQLHAEQDLVNRYKGEVHFLRAWTYLELAERYGGVPLITKTFELGEDYQVKRSSYDSIIRFIVADCDSAAALLPSNYSDDRNYGRASNGAAMALKSRALLYAASPLWNTTNDKSKWQAAADAAKSVMSLSTYQLYQGSMGSYYKIFTDNSNSEIIFQRTMDPANPDRFLYIEQVEGPNGGINPGGQYGGWNTNSPSQNLVDAFGMKDGLSISESPLYNPQDPYKNRDPRFYADINYDEVLWHGVPLEFFEGGRNSPQNTQNSDARNCSRTGYTMRKHLNPTFDYNNDPIGSTYNPWIIFRISEMYLNYAEAMYHLEKENEARTTIDALRSRPSVNLPPINASGKVLLEAIYREREVELCFEAQRFWDVRRWKITDSTENKPLMGIKIIKQPDNSKTYSVKIVQQREFHSPGNYLFPIPLYELQKVKLDQNPGY